MHGMGIGGSVIVVIFCWFGFVYRSLYFVAVSSMFSRWFYLNIEHLIEGCKRKTTCGPETSYWTSQGRDESIVKKHE